MTCPQKRTAIHAAISILTPARGVTFLLSSHFRYLLISILTPARGVTPGSVNCGESSKYFNSHPREGGDGLGRAGRTEHLISILTPARGVTDNLIRGHNRKTISILTPARGVTIILIETGVSSGISILTPARGVTISTRLQIPPNRFQFSPPRGG